MLRFLFLFAFIISFYALPSHSADTSVGTAVKASGYTAMTRRNLIFPLSENEHVFWKDILQTRGEARLEIVFKDDTRLMMGNDSELIIDELVYEPNKTGRALFTLSQGVFRMVSGALNKIKDSSFVVRTPLATIGARGTDFWGLQTDKKLTIALLDDGELEISTANGSIILTDPLSAVVIEFGKGIGQPFTLTEEQLEQAKKTIE